ncbi:MAG: YjdF family protein [Oscillibacter sp.]|nr:YjdF family protein [Oscillibacter sp.]
MTSTTSLTVFFEGPFWVGVFERTAEGTLSVCRVVFGAEPREQEIYELILKKYTSLLFSPPVKAEAKQDPTNPKRMQRKIRQQMRTTGIGTKSQQALSLQREAQKEQRSGLRREEKAARDTRLFAQKQQKRKEKHRGH